MNHRVNSCDSAELYVLGGLDEADKDAFELHLANCPECVVSVKELQSIVNLLPLASEPVIVPSGMKARVLGNVILSSGNNQSLDQSPVAEQSTVQEQQENTRIKSVFSSVMMNNQPPQIPQSKQKNKSSMKWLNVGLAAAVAGLCVYTFTLRDQVNNLHDKLAGMSVPTQGLRMDKAVTLSSAAQDIVAQGLATIVIDNLGTHLLVQTEKLPQIKGNEAFQVWLMKDGQKVINAGTFFPHNDKGILYFTLDPSMENYNQIAITREPDAFGVLPRGTPVLTAAIQL